MVTHRQDAKPETPVRCCLHVQVQHEHGTRAAYVLDRCRCAPCTAANTVQARRRSTAIAYGTWPGLVDADLVRAHVRAFRADGLSVQRIAELSGVGQGTLSALVYRARAGQPRPPARVRADTQRRLLAVRFDPASVAAGRRIDATGARRRLQALTALGWSAACLALRTDRTVRTLRRILMADEVTADTARCVAALYEQLRTARPPRRTGPERAAADRAAGRAWAAGWRPPLGWDDIDTDQDETTQASVRGTGLGIGKAGGDPTNVIRSDIVLDDSRCSQLLDEVAVQRAMTGERLPLTKTERREAVARLTRQGLSARRIAELLHTTGRTVTRLRGAGTAVAHVINPRALTDLEAG